MDDMTERLTGVFCAIFGDETLGRCREMIADDVAARDSVSQITPIYVVENAFGRRFGLCDLKGSACIGAPAIAHCA